MRARWRLSACIAVVLLVHGALMAVLLRASTSGVPRPPPHRMAAVRMIVLAPYADPGPAAPSPVLPAALDEARPVAPALPPDEPGSAPAAEPEARAAARLSALAPERIASEPPSPQAQTTARAREFLSPSEVDRIPIAFPSPDISRLSGLSWSGIPLRLRLFVDADGHCVEVKVLRASEDSATLERVRQMFLATHFLPARHAGADVDSYRDIELNVSDIK